MTIKTISDYVLSVIFRFFGFLASKISAKMRLIVGSLLGNLVICLSPKRKQITLENIQMAYPDNSGEVNLKILKESYKNLGITLIEMAAMRHFSSDYLKKIITFENFDLMKSLFDRGKGIILLSGHYANWEFAAYFSGLMLNQPITIVAHALANPIVDKLVNDGRSRNGNMIVSMSNAARNLVSTLRNGGVVGLLADQSATFDKDIYVDFFGRPASTFTAPAILALRFRSPLIFGFSERKADGTYRIRVDEINYSDLENNSEGVAELTRRHVALLEEQIRKNPGQWSWMHRRWKHTAFANNYKS